MELLVVPPVLNLIIWLPLSDVSLVTYVSTGTANTTLALIGNVTSLYVAPLKSLNPPWIIRLPKSHPKQIDQAFGLSKLNLTPNTASFSLSNALITFLLKS